MFGDGGKSYVYLCYGIHHLFNVVTNFREVPHAVLIRAIKPVDGISTMLERRKIESSKEIIALVRSGKKKIAGGPGTVSQALGIKTTHTGIDLCGNKIWIEDRGLIPEKSAITAGPRIGVAYAQDHALWPYRFILHI
jgi:DNA-3-methyladenine glycosylase